MVVNDYLFDGQAFYWYVLAVFIYSLIAFWGSYFVDSNYHFKVLSKGSSSNKVLSLTFDDGPHPTLTPAILEILNRYNIKGSFFCIGKHVEQHPETVALLSQQGHLVANHTYTHHFWFDMYNANKMAKDLQHANTLIKDSIGLYPKLFRPPYGVTNPNLGKAIRHTGLTPVGWSVRSMDTVTKTKAALAKRLQNLQNGDIILFHDTCEITVSYLEEFITSALAKGFQFERVDKLLNIEAYEA